MRQWGCFGQPIGGWLALDSSSLHLSGAERGLHVALMT